jgi:hypothetical protein
MPLNKALLPNDLITFHDGGRAAVLNRQTYPELQAVEGEPTYSPGSPRGAMREAFVAWKIAGKRAAEGSRQRVYLGDPAIEILYGRIKKKKNERDCDVVGYICYHGSYGYFLGEGKGASIADAKEQFDQAETLLKGRTKEPGPILGAVIAMDRLRYFEWSAIRKQWVAYVDNVEERNITNTLEPNVAKAKPTLQQERIYLLDGPEEYGLPTWNIVKGHQPFTIYVHDRRPGTERGSFRPVRVGTGPLEVHYLG